MWFTLVKLKGYGLETATLSTVSKRILEKRTSMLRTSHPSIVEPATLTIMELSQDLFKEALKILIKFTGKTVLRKLFPEVSGSGSIFVILLKTYSTKDILRQRARKISPFKILENSLLDVFFIPFLTKLQPFIYRLSLY